MTKLLFLIDCLGDWSGSCETGFTFDGNPCEELLDLSNSFTRVETFRAGLGAVHNGVTSEKETSYYHVFMFLRRKFEKVDLDLI